MPTRYSPDYKALVRRLLWMYGGNVPLVSHITGIPQRTLRDWQAVPLAMFPGAIRREEAPEWREHGTLPPEKNIATAAADDLEKLREHLLHQALTLVTSLSEDVAETPLPQRAIALTRLIDRIVKLDTHTGNDYEEVIHIAFEDRYSKQDSGDAISQQQSNAEDAAAEQKPPFEG